MDEVEAGAVADFANGERAAALRDAFVQAIAVDEDVLAFGEAGAGVVVDVLVVVATRLAVGVEGEAGVFEEHGGFALWCGRGVSAWAQVGGKARLPLRVKPR